MKTVLVYGSACSGKNTYVREHSHEGDLIIDFDALHQAISGLSSHGHDENLIGYVYDARDARKVGSLSGHHSRFWAGQSSSSLP